MVSPPITRTLGPRVQSTSKCSDDGMFSSPDVNNKTQGKLQNLINFNNKINVACSAGDFFGGRAIGSHSSV